MCVIFVCEDRKPELRHLRMAFQWNFDGVGVAWRHRRSWKYRKGIYDLDTLISVLAPLSPPLVIHFRHATSSERNAALCHPFPLSRQASDQQLSGSARNLLFHKGHIERWRDVLAKLCARRCVSPGGDWSDSRFLAYSLSFFKPAERIQALAEHTRCHFVLCAPNVIHRIGAWHPLGRGMWVTNRPINSAPEYVSRRKPTILKKLLENGLTPELVSALFRKEERGPSFQERRNLFSDILA
jgi:hypothetical protein